MDPNSIRRIAGGVLLVVGFWYLSRYWHSVTWDESPEPTPSIEHEGDDWSSTPYPGCLPYGNSNSVSQPDLPHLLCFDGSGRYSKGPSTRFL